MQDIKEYTTNVLDLAIDCISEGNSIPITVGAMGSSGGIYTTMLPVSQEVVDKFNQNVQAKLTIGYTVFNEPAQLGGVVIPQQTQDFEFGKKFWNLTQRLLEKGTIKVHRPSVNKFGSGLGGVLKGLDAMRQGKVSGEKLVFTI